jgi:branched-chain amino acid transport system ATP-binding protein
MLSKALSPDLKEASLSNEPMLKLSNLSLSYGDIKALKGVDLEVRRGECVSLIGSNGAGKTSLLKAITKLCASRFDALQFEGQDLSALASSDLVGLGLVMVPEGRGVFSRMTVLENLLMGAYVRADALSVQEDVERMMALFPRLRERVSHLAGYLSGGEQQMLSMARALMARPRMMLLDEPSMGLSPIMVEKIFEVIGQLRSQGMTILLVEQNAMRALEMADRGYVMDSGLITLEGPAQSLLHNPSVQAAYLGLGD